MTDLENAANQRLNAETSPGNDAPKKRGRPKGSKNRPKDASGNPKPQTTDTSGPETHDWKNFVYVRDESSVQASTILGSTVWGIASLMLPVRPLNESEAIKLGEALDPVLCRWIPVFGAWKYELGLLMIIVALARETHIEQPKQTDSSAEVLDNVAG